MPEPLNPALYNRLLSYYGEVDIVREGYAINWRTVAESIPGQTGVTFRREVLDQGEEYRVRCSVCQDHRARLHINHMWGEYDPETNSQNFWLINCFNENCFSEYVHQHRLYEKIFGQTRHTIPHVIRPGRASNPNVLSPIDPPGPMISLEELMIRHPAHPAITYLIGRGFDPVKVSRLWSVEYCWDSHFRQATNRIIIPFYQDNMLVGWQARYIGDDVNGERFNEAGVAKYWTSPGMLKRLIAYNLERALTHSTAIIVEGPADCWNVGPMAMGLIGTTMSQELRARVVRTMHEYHGDRGILVIALDSKKLERRSGRERPHHIDALETQLFDDMQGRVVPVWLPEEFDPGSIDRQVFRSLVVESARRKGLEVSFARPTVNIERSTGVIT